MIIKTKEEDIKEILEIIKDSKKQLKEAGVNQWQGEYPNREVFLEDIENNISYVYKKGDILGTIAFSLEEEKVYRNLEEGRWLKELKGGEYGVIHRIAVSKSSQGLGISDALLEFCSEKAKEENIESLRTDTHIDNESMKRLLKRNGFLYCGIVSYPDGKRETYEKLL